MNYSAFDSMVRKGWISCPECGGSDVMTYTDIDTTEFIACRDCDHETRISLRELHFK